MDLWQYFHSILQLSSHADQMEAIDLARLEMKDIVSELKVKLATKSKLPPATRYNVEPGDMVYIFSERDAVAKRCF